MFFMLTVSQIILLASADIKLIFGVIWRGGNSAFFIDEATVILCAVGVSDSMHSKYIVYMFDIWKYFNCEAFK